MSSGNLPRDYNFRDPLSVPTYNDPEYLRNRSFVLARDLWCEGYPVGIHGNTRVRTTTADHIKPLSQGGTHALDNLEAMCASCNSSKGAEERVSRPWR